MATPAPPAVDSKKPVTPPPQAAVKDKTPGADKPATGAKTQADHQANASQSPSGAQAAPAQTPPEAAQAAKHGAAKDGNKQLAGNAGGANGAQQRFDHMAVRAKLAVSEPGDAVEREADAMAESISRKHDSAQTGKPSAPSHPQKPAQGAAGQTPIHRKSDPALEQPSAAPGKATGAGAKVGSPAASQTSSLGQTPAKTQAPAQAQAPGSTPSNAATTGNNATTGKNAANAQTANQATAPSGPAASASLQRKTAPGEDAQPKAPSAAEASSSQDTGAQIKAQRGQGEPLGEDIRARMERDFGHDFSQVRIHQDSRAHDLCRSLGALAFTTGNDIFFAAGQYQPTSKSGVALLAHELTHVVQQQDSGPAIACKLDPDLPAKHKPKTSQAATDKALANMSKLDIPAVKTRHLPLYQGLLGGKLKRKRGYDRGNPNQVGVWNKMTIGEAAIRKRLTARNVKGVPTKKDEVFKFALGADKKVKAWSINTLEKKLKIPEWSRHGKAPGSGFQVDHIVELQVSGENGEGTGNSLENMELLDQPSNSSSGGAIRSGIYKKVDAFLETLKPAPTRRTFLKSHDIVFEGVQANLKTGAPQGDSAWWSYADIKDAAPLDQVSSAPPSDQEGNIDEFLLASGPGGVVIQKFVSKTKGAKDYTVSGPAKNAIAGVVIDSISINDQAAKGSGDIGTITGTWNLPAKWSTGNSAVTLSLTGDGKYRGFASKLGKAKLHFAELSPVEFDDVLIEDGKLSAEGQLTPSLPLLNTPITVTLKGEELRFALTYSAGDLSLPAPLSIDDASISVFYSTTEQFGISGSLMFSIDKVGGGELSASYTQGKGVSVAGQFNLETDLFDTAKVEAWWRQPDGFGASGELAITQPGKIKGLKAANLKVKYEKGLFTANGSADTDIPGIKGFKADVKFVDENNFSISGQGDLDKLPGIEGGSLTMTVDRKGDDWALSGKGQVTPKLPGGASGSIEGSYKEGVVLLRGNVHFSYGDKLLDGNVMVAVTNAATVDKDGNASGEGGKDFKIFGEGELNAALIKDKLDGKVKLRLLPDGSVRVGGGLKAKDFEVFGKYPKDGGEFLNKTFSTPPVPIPGLGFSVGSVSVGVTFSASLTAKAHASIGPGKLTGISLTVAEFDPANIDFNSLEIGGGGTFAVYADAGFGVTAKINLIFGAAVAELVGSVGAEASVGIPADKPIVSAHTDFTYSLAKGLNLEAGLNLDLAPELKFRLFGEVSARLNLLVDTITVWKKDWTLAEANYKLPVGIKASGKMGYNSKTGKITPEKPADAISVEQPKLDAEAMKGVVTGDTAPPRVKNEEQGGTQVNPNPEVRPQRQAGAEGPRQVDDSLLQRLGEGFPLDDSTRNYFEQRLNIDLTRVRLHTEPRAAQEAERLNARAFTLGDHIVFNQGEFQPQSPEGQELLTHEMAHVAQNQGVSEPIVMRWPAVHRTTAQSSETPASIRAMRLEDFVNLTNRQLDWATSTDLQADPGALGTFRQIQAFGNEPQIKTACADLTVTAIEGKGVPAVFPHLRKYKDGAATGTTAWLRGTTDINKAERWGRDLNSLESTWPAANLSLVMRAPDPVSNPSPFERLSDGATPELPNFISYLSTCSPILSADNGAEVGSFLALRGEGVMPTSYTGSLSHVKNFHHFTKKTLNGLVSNEATPQWRQNTWPFKKPMTAVLYPSVDHNGAFHRNLGLETMVNDSAALTIVIEGLTSVADYATALAPVASRYGRDGQIQQAMIGGHGNTNIMVLAGTMSGNTISDDSIGTSGTLGANTNTLMTALNTVMSTNPAERRIVLDACLTNSHLVSTGLSPTAATAASEINTSIAANPSLRDHVANLAGAGSTVIGSNSSFAPADTAFVTSGNPSIGLSTATDPDLAGSKIAYVEFGTEPEGCMRAVLECWAADQIAGTSLCQDAMTRRIAKGHSAHVSTYVGWFEAIIQSLYYLATHGYAGNGEALRRMGYLASHLTEMYWGPDASAAAGAQASGLNSLFASALGGSAADVGRVLTALAADSHYTSNPRIPLAIEQVWMNYDASHRPKFMAALLAAGDCSLASHHLAMPLIMPHVASLLSLPPPAAPPGDQLRLALVAALHAPVASPPPSPLPAHIDFLTSLYGAGPDFPAALSLSTVLGVEFSSDGILTAIGKPIPGAAPVAPVSGPTPPPDANIDTTHDATNLNDFRVTPLSANGEVDTLSSDLLVRSTPTTSSSRNIIAHLPKGTRVIIIGEYNANWYAIEQPGRAGFVFKRYIKIVP